MTPNFAEFFPEILPQIPFGGKACLVQATIWRDHAPLPPAVIFGPWVSPPSVIKIKVKSRSMGEAKLMGAAFLHLPLIWRPWGTSKRREDDLLPALKQVSAMLSFSENSRKLYYYKCIQSKFLGSKFRNIF